MTGTPMTVAQRMGIAVRFVILGVGGFLLIMICWANLESRFTTPPTNFRSPGLAAPLLLVGALMMLFGAGEWRRWAYLWVFASTPICISSVIRMPSFFGGGKATGMLIFSLPVIISYVIVRGYYRRQDARAHMARNPNSFRFRTRGIQVIDYHIFKVFRFLCALCVSALSFSSLCFAQAEKPEWCKNLPRPEYKTLLRVLPDETWFEVYKVAPAVFALYEPHQAEETISYLIVGTKQALLFDTGMGIGNLKAVVARLTSRPIVVLNSHTHDDHVGGNWQFPFVFGMDTAFTRANAKGSSADAQAEIAKDQICGALPKGFNPATYATKPWKISLVVRDGFKVNLGGRAVEIIATPGHTPDAISLIDRENGLLFTGDTYYPGEIWLYRPETNLAAYLASVAKVNQLVPQLKLVLGAHNVPVAQPEVLSKLSTATQMLIEGKIPVKSINGDQAIYSFFDEISFRVHHPLRTVNSPPGKP